MDEREERDWWEKIWGKPLYQPFWTDLLNVGLIAPPDPNGVTITLQPVDDYVNEGQDLTFTCAATSGDASPLVYQWQIYYLGSWINLSDTGRVSGSGTDTLTVSNSVPGDDGAAFRCKISNDTNTRYTNTVFAHVVAGSNWILLTGFWNDSGAWEDGAIWVD